MTQPAWGRADRRDTAARPPDEPPAAPLWAQEPPWEVDLRSDPPEPRYRPRRELRDQSPSPAPEPAPYARPQPQQEERTGPTTQELALYRAGARERGPATAAQARPHEARLLPWEGERPRGERAKDSVQRWSRWASGLGLPPRDGRGYERYAKADRLIPPAVWVAVAMGVTGLVGLLAGVLISAPSSGPPPAAAALPTTATRTVTRQVTQPPVTETTTRTRTRTVTVTAPTQEPAPGNGGGLLGPGAQGPQVQRLQADLAGLGLYPGQPSGTYDELTRAGVQAFQAQHGVTGDPAGVAGSATLQALAAALGR